MQSVWKKLKRLVRKNKQKLPESLVKQYNENFGDLFSLFVNNNFSLNVCGAYHRIITKDITKQAHLYKFYDWYSLVEYFHGDEDEAQDTCYEKIQANLWRYHPEKWGNEKFIQVFMLDNTSLEKSQAFETHKELEAQIDVDKNQCIEMLQPGGQFDANKPMMIAGTTDVASSTFAQQHANMEMVTCGMRQVCYGKSRGVPWGSLEPLKYI